MLYHFTVINSQIKSLDECSHSAKHLLSPTLYASQRTSNSEMVILSHEVSLRVFNFQCQLHFYNCIHHTQKREENKRKRNRIEIEK